VYILQEAETMTDPSVSLKTLRSSLRYEPTDLKFGTSGRRGLVADLTQLEIYINATAELEYLQGLPLVDGGIIEGDEFFFAYDLRPTSTEYVAEERGRGEIAQAIERAIRDAGMRPVNLGRIPTPALTCYATAQRKGSIMVTGSHIPFDRNGYKTNTSVGELLKKHESPIQESVERVKARIYQQPYELSLFDEDGRFKSGHRELMPEDGRGQAAYADRYIQFFRGESLKGMRLLFYQHSAVGRDLVVEILRKLGAEVIPVGRSDSFVPIDTENIDAAQLAFIQNLVNEATKEHGMVHAIVSTDGDSDRPLLLGVDFATSKVHFFGGDLLGMVSAEFLGADAVVVPISCNDAIDRGVLAEALEPKTKIGSPFVVAGMDAALRKGRRRVCGWEANGGFLTGSDITRGENLLPALPTRDAVLPLLCCLFSAHLQELSLEELFARLPRRFSFAALLKQFPRSTALRIVENFSPGDKEVRDVRFEKDQVSLFSESGGELVATVERIENALSLRHRLGGYFRDSDGFGEIVHLNYTDGVRVTFSNEDIAHIRPSGNADELRIYAVANIRDRAGDIASIAVSEPDGILRRMEKALSDAGIS
jgi:phosphomannomutase